jgi:Ca-activated chloride channel family protein
MIRSVTRRLVGTLVSVGLTVCVFAQTPTEGPQLTIVSPESDAFVSGLTMLRASLDPPQAASAVSFFVDGRQLCVVSQPPFDCEWEAGRTIEEHQIRVVAALAGGGRIVKTVRTKSLGYAENVDVDVVQVTVTVTDSQGRFVHGLPLSAFHVFEEGRAQAISHFDSENVPLELIVAIDISGSMTSAVPKLKEAVKAFLGAVPAAAQVTLIGFNDTIFTLTRRTMSPADRIKAVDRLAPWGATSLYDVIIRGTDMLGSQPGRKALVVFTDGEDRGSFATIADVERRLQSSEVTVYMIAQGAGLTDQPLRTIMSRIAAPTGGRALFTDRIEELHGAFDDLLDELANQYLLGYPRPNLARDGKWRRISVEVDGHRQIRARQGDRATKNK